VVLGAGLFAANLSTIFRLRQFGMSDKVPFSVNITLEGEAGEDGSEGRTTLQVFACSICAAVLA
jgi:hypothetical protein